MLSKYQIIYVIRSVSIHFDALGEIPIIPTQHTF